MNESFKPFKRFSSFKALGLDNFQISGLKKGISKKTSR